MSENVGASTSRNPKGLHGMYRDNFTFTFTTAAWRMCNLPVGVRKFHHCSMDILDESKQAHPPNLIHVTWCYFFHFTTNKHLICMMESLYYFQLKHLNFNLIRFKILKLFRLIFEWFAEESPLSFSWSKKGLENSFFKGFKQNLKRSTTCVLHVIFKATSPRACAKSSLISLCWSRNSLLQQIPAA
jgi:hypothetical protein